MAISQTLSVQITLFAKFDLVVAVSSHVTLLLRAVHWIFGRLGRAFKTGGCVNQLVKSHNTITPKDFDLRTCKTNI